MPAYIPGTEALAADVAPLLQVIEGGQTVGGGAQILQFTGDAAVAASELSTTEVVVATGNGAAQTATLVVGEGAGGAAVTSGLAVGAVPLSVAIPAIACSLGLTVAVSSHFYPDEWKTIGEELTALGATIGGRVRCFLGDDGNTYYDEATIEYLKNYFIARGFYQGDHFDYDVSDLRYPNRFPDNFALSSGYYVYYGDGDTRRYIRECLPGDGSLCYAYKYNGVTWINYIRQGRADNTKPIAYQYYYRVGNPKGDLQGIINYNEGQAKDGTWYSWYSSWSFRDSWQIENGGSFDTDGSHIPYQPDAGFVSFQGTKVPGADIVQPDADEPDLEIPFPQSYPTWRPYSFPPEITQPGNLPVVYPVEIPDANPNQQESQNPDPERYPDGLPDWIRKITEFPDPYPEVVPYPAYEPNPVPLPDPEAVPEPDPDPNPVPSPSPAPQPEPLPEVDPYSVPEGNPEPLPQNDPINPTQPSNIPDPNPTPPTDTVPAVIPIPTTVSSNKLFTVYAPTMTQLNQLGGFLWSTSIIDELKKIWQDPLDGVIKLHRIFAVPTTGNSQHIILGTIDSEVSALVVTDQYKEYNLGSISIPRFYNNILDYAPFTSIGIFLPFIGFKELNTNEIMGGMLTVKYKVDIYTGVCIAQLLVSRQPDIPAVKVLYTFVGNMSQEIPLTALTQRGLYTSILEAGVAVGGLAATGGASALNAASTIGHAALREMNSVERSGNLSSNAGIMGEKSAYLIIRRRKGYDANSYNTLYGYPANKTMMLGNCKGYTKVKYVQLETAATQEEKNELETLLKGGVLL